jgi:hypothetical protein
MLLQAPDGAPVIDMAEIRTRQYQTPFCQHIPASYAQAFIFGRLVVRRLRLADTPYPEFIQ